MKMEFESPDVEKEFPGLYASESGRKSNESDFSDEAHERPSKKDLLIGKRKDKKDSKKDRGYAALEGESSPEEDPEIKSPSKSKKSKSFKFPSSSKKEKREKSREKDCKEKEREIDKEKKKEKEKDGKVKLKLKERKKSKHGDDPIEVADEQSVFGIPLHLAVKRSRCHDGVDIPLVVRNSIDYIEEHGLKTESIYKISGIKSKVQHLRRLYNQREPVELSDYEVSAVTSLLKQFFRELPEPVLTTELLPRFEEAAASKEVIDREIELCKMVHQLPECNRQLLAWLLIHLENITLNDKHNKMNAQNIAITLSPVLQMSHRLLTALLCHCKSLFPNITLNKYIPPLSSGSPSLPESGPAIAEELRKQESLLNQIHQEMNAGFVSKQKEEQLWEVQRIITQLKRKLRTVQRSRDIHQNQKSFEEDRSAYKPSEEEFHIDLTLQKAHSCSEEDTTTISAYVEPPNVKPLPCEQNQAGSVSPLTVEAVDGSDLLNDRSASPREEIVADLSSDATEMKAFDQEDELECLLQEEAILQVQHQELLHMQADLQGRVQGEREEIEKLRTQLAITKAKYNNYSGFGGDSTEGSSSPSLSDHSDMDDPQMEREIVELKNENFLLQQKKSSLVSHIMEEREMCLHLRVQLSLTRLSQESKQL